MTGQSLKLILGLACCVSLSACTTVNFSAFGDSEIMQAEAEADQANVVELTTDALLSSFDERGYGLHMKRSRIAMAADILMNGFRSEHRDNIDSAYADTLRTPDVIAKDIVIAKGYVDRTVSAAQIFKRTADIKDPFKSELKRLEAALSKSENAALGFEMALEAVTVHDTVSTDTPSLSAVTQALADLELSIDDLRNVTDDYGMSVRARRQHRRSGTQPTV